MNPNVMIEFHMSRAAEKERILGSSTEGSVFNYEYLQSHQEFKGSIIAADRNRKDLENIEKLLKKDKLHLGRSKKSQYGTAIVVDTAIREVEKEAVNDKAYLYALTPYIPKCDASRLDNIAKEITDKINIKMIFK